MIYEVEKTSAGLMLQNRNFTARINFFYSNCGTRAVGANDIIKCQSCCHR